MLFVQPEQNEVFLYRTIQRSFLQSLVKFGQVVSEEKMKMFTENRATDDRTTDKVPSHKLLFLAAISWKYQPEERGSNCKNRVAVCAKFEPRISGYTYINTKNILVITYNLITIKNFDNNQV